MGLNPEQQRAVEAPGSVAVIAGAGTGKTHLLVERYRHLLERGLTPLEIVAVTFTNKAADELRARIRTRVAEATEMGPVTRAELEVAPIGTIHSLAGRICREHPDASGAPIGFTIFDEVDGAAWQAEQFSSVLAELPAEIYTALPYEAVRAVLARLLADPIAAQRAFAHTPAEWPTLVAATRRQALAGLLDAPTWRGAAEVVQGIEGSPGDKIEDQRRRAIDCLRILAGGARSGAGEGSKERPDLDDAGALDALAALKLTGGSSKSWPGGAAELQEVKDALTALRDATRTALKDGLVTLTLGPADSELAAVLPVLRRAFDAANKALALAKHRARVLDFSDLEVHALRALGQAAVRDYYAQRWKAFLIDEFQDTNAAQADLLGALVGDDASVTIVGDPKQSIYGFRRADPAGFERFSRRIVERGGQHVWLETTYRTHGDLVQSVNQVFRAVLGSSHQDLSAQRTEAPHPAPHLRIITIGTEKDDGTNAGRRRRAEAAEIAARLTEMLEQATPIFDPARPGLRALRPGDIAVIARTWETLGTVGDALEAAGIPTVLTGGDSLLEAREVKDACALLRFLADPTDQIALVAVLRSPFFAISDPTLFTFASARSPGVGWWDGLSAAEEASLIAARAILDDLLRARLSESPSRLLQLADRWTGYTAAIANLPGAARREADWRGFLDWVRRLERGDGDVFVIVRRLKQLIAAGISVPRPPLRAADAVALLTIHAAKGLEWPVVVIPDLTRRSPNNSPPIRFDPELGLALRLADPEGATLDPALFRILQEKAKRDGDAEARRLLYVAFTRARDHLILTAASPTGGSLDLLRDGLASAEITPLTVACDPDVARPPIQPDPPPYPTPARILLGDVGPGLTSLPATALSEYALCPKRFRFLYVDGHPGLGDGPAVARHVGRLTHRAIEGMIREESELARLEPDEPTDYIQEALTLARRYYDDAVYQRWRADRVQREVRVRLSVRHLVLHGIVDQLGPLDLLDFKTDRQMRPEQHRFQLWVYARAVRVETASIAYLRHNRAHTFDGAALAATDSAADEMIRAIRAGHFSATPSPSACAWCPYAAICADRDPRAAAIEA